MQSEQSKLRLLYAKADDAVRLCSARNKMCCVGFFNEAEQSALCPRLQRQSLCSYTFYGGAANAQRAYLCVYPLGEDFDKTKAPISAVCFTYKPEFTLAHRDFLGAAMSLGIKRESIGDIIIGEGSAVMLVSDGVCPLILSELTKIGSKGVKAQLLPNCDIEVKQESDELILNCASLRADSVVAAVTGLSRDKTAKYIIAGNVTLNYAQLQSVSTQLKCNDILSVRRYGKYIIKDILGATKKGRLRVLVNCFR